MLSHQADDTINAVKKDTSDMTIEWVLDSASDCHVRTNKEILINLRFNDGPMVFDWEGKASQYTEQIGEVELILPGKPLHRIWIKGFKKGFIKRGSRRTFPSPDSYNIA
ncbi:hypothetical protein DD238_008236 [Peronospora effusa]|uniref:Uncharacterized protein n=1 Tax=Peronospora effusa TaxID=542832 RepID=A0A3M6VAY8_9STRA|nr:hypothetical protein DD238_008236 [Peronospora effusa]